MESVTKLADERLAQLPMTLRTLSVFERFHLHNPEYWQHGYEGLDPAYFPQNCGVFELPSFWIARRHLHLYQSEERCADQVYFTRGAGFHQEVLFPIHPLSLGHYRRFLDDVHARQSAAEGLHMLAVPTASARTLLVWPDNAPEKACFVKTTMVLRPGGGDWRLRAKKLGFCVGLTKLLRESVPSLPDSFRYLPESTGIVPRQMLDSGVLIRSIPEEIKNGQIAIAPLFSLYGGSDFHQPLLLTLAQEARVNPFEFVEETLCTTFSRVWLELSMRFGLMAEVHAQNLLLAFSPDMTPLPRFYYRDFEGLMVDWAMRRALGLSQPPEMPWASSWYDTYAAMYPGQPYWEMVWLKMAVSLYAYLNLFLSELDRSMRSWQASGRLGGPALQEDGITMMFSRHIVGAAAELFGVRAKPDYNIYLCRNKFLVFLLSIRKELMRTPRVDF